MTHKIFDANDRAKEEHAADKRNTYTNHRERMLFDFSKIAGRPIPYWRGEIGNDMPLKAYINGGRWLVKCECGGVENVTPDDPIVFCHECGNKVADGKSRPVIFPSKSERMKIEKELMKQIPNEKGFESLAPSQRSAAATRREWYPEEDK